ncbi:hypothetical protein [Microbacterium sp. SA39]|uniref:hypothetical protein n=1 Tax=Microbacterium sp. SA39 TaxID=1263625 RepID=UPI0005F9E963|nr:hypothetical protein [Microbacterium sp. SA39]KJQ55603.1 hypothetical protein RS85_00466 [Microbacterium sp. SA39]
MRIRTPSTKVGYLLIVAVGITLTAIPLAAISFELGFAWAVIALVAAVAVAARTFRGAGESDAPRPWWKMTSSRGSGILLSVLFLVQGITASFGAFASPSPTLAVTGSVVALITAVFYLNSAIRVHHHAAQPVRGEL